LVGQTAIARIGHMQTVGANHRRRRELVRALPLLHDRKAAKKTDMSFSRNLCDEPLHLRPGRPRQYLRSVLHVHQHDVAAVLLDRADTAPDQLFIRRKIVAPENGVGAELPDDEIGTDGEDIAIDTDQLLRHILAADAMVDYPDLDSRNTVLQLF